MAEPNKTNDAGAPPDAAMATAREEELLGPVPAGAALRSALQARGDAPPPSAASANDSAPPGWFADRYRVEQRLGRGGMAEVYRVYDTASRRTLALKRLIQHENSAFAAHIGQLFEHEFHTLSQLGHPRIVAAYDYYRDAAGPYYTMELLDGGDLRELTPLSWQKLAKLLCDVCSALALLHSRQLLHRDLTPLNIRCTRDGNAKLFDFGSMTQTGVNLHIVGTPPFIAPEALAGQVLDARTDLFALGATAYFALSGRHAYPAGSMAALQEVWRRPPARLSEIAPGIPPDLEDLVHSLLALDPSHRPPSAAVVMERLSALAGFSVDDSLQIQRAYLATPNLVGREDMLQRARKHLTRADAGRGGALLIHGSAGSGRSRFLAACALEARLSGALVLRLDAHASSGGKWAGVRVLMRQLAAEDPQLCKSALAPYRDVLARLLPNLFEPDAAAGAAPEPDEEEALAEQRPAIQSALRKALAQLSEQRLLLIAVDDVPRLDEPSAALIALLAHEAIQRRLLVFATAETDDQASGRAIALLTASSDAVRLRSLFAQETLQLAMSLFGDVPNVRLVADRLHAASSGSPGVIMQLAEQLLERGVVRYGAGAWLLPTQLDLGGWPNSASERMVASVRALSAEARALAEAIALCGARSLSLDDCRLLRAHGDAQRLTLELNELLARGILVSELGSYFFSRPEFETLVAADSGPASADLQRRAAEVFLRRGDAFRTYRHLFLAGDAAPAIERLVDYLENMRERRVQKPEVMLDVVLSLPKQWPETLQAMMEACERLGRPRREYFVLQANLVANSILVGRDPGPHLRASIAQLSRDSGLDLYEQSKEPKDTRLHVALAAAVDRYEKTPERERVLGPIAAIPRLAQMETHAIAWGMRTLDTELLAWLPSLAPLAPLSPALSVIQRDVDACLALLRGHFDEARSIYLELLLRLDQPDRAGLEGSAFKYVRLALIMGVATLEVSQGLPTLERWTAELEREPLFSVTACRLQRQDALMLGALRRAEELRAEAERRQIQNPLPQLFEGLHLLPQVIAESESEDLLRVKQSVAEIEEMARQYANWEPCLHFARAAFQALRGDTSRALEELERALTQVPVGRHAAWLAIATRTLQLLNRAGRFQEAVDRGRALIATLERKRLRFQTYPLMGALALAEAATGHLASAANHAEAAINDIEMRGGRGVLLGYAYEMRARVALYALDAEDFATYAQLCDEQYRLGQNPALVARHKRLLRDAVDAGLLPAATTGQAPAAIEPQSNAWATLLSSCKGPDERATRALSLIAQHSRSPGGYLYTLGRQGPALVATQGAGPPPEPLDQLVARYLIAALDDKNEMDATTVSAPSEFKEAEIARSQAWEGYTPMLLSHVDDNRDLSVVGLAVMLSSRGQVHRIPHRLLSTLSKTLLDTGDVPGKTQVATWRTR